MSGMLDFQEALCRLSVADIMSLFPRLALTARQRKAEIVTTVLDNATSEETEECIDMYLTQVAMRRRVEREKASSTIIFQEGNEEPEEEASRGTILQDGTDDYPAAPSASDIRYSQQAYLAVFMNEMLRVVQCGICGCEICASESHTRQLLSIDKALLMPLHRHRDMVLIDGCLLHLPGIAILRTCNEQLTIIVCDNCETDVKHSRRPYLSLACGCWVGDI